MHTVNQMVYFHLTGPHSLGNNDNHLTETHLEDTFEINAGGNPAWRIVCPLGYRSSNTRRLKLDSSCLSLEDIQPPG